MRVARTLLALSLAAAPLALLPSSSAAQEQTVKVDAVLTAQLQAAGDGDRLAVAVHGQTTRDALDAVGAAGLVRVSTFDEVGVVLANGTPGQVRAVLGQPGLTYLEGDQQLEYTMDTSHIATRGAQAREAFRDSRGRPIDGSGVSVAVIDSGIDGTHPFFRRADGKSAVVRNLKTVCPLLNPSPSTGPCFQDVPSNDTDSISNGGHGTHVAGTVAGGIVQTTTPRAVTLQGAAPGASLVGLSVGQTISVFASSQAFDFVVKNHRAPCGAGVDPAICPPIKSTNNSYGPPGGGRFNEDSVVTKLQRQLVSEGVISVWAAGNDAGDGTGSPSDPMDAQSTTQNTNPQGQDPTPGILMVASYNDGGSGNRDLALSGFSSRGVRGEKGTYPDISAPGDTITSSCRLGSLPICQGEPSFDNGNYQTISGTSMATPHIAGIVAQLFQAAPTATPAQLEDVLEDTAHKFLADYEDDPLNTDDTTSFDKGHGLVDVAAAVASLQRVAAPAAPAPACQVNSLQVVDPAGDATQTVAADAPIPSQPSVDITNGFLTWDASTRELTMHLRVTDLSAGPPLGSSGEFFRYYFSVGSGPEHFLVASRTATAQTFSLRQQDPAKTVPLTGAFDEALSEVRVVLPAAAYATAFSAAPMIEQGAVVGTNQVLGQRQVGASTVTTDTATGSCGFVVGVSEPAVGGEEEQPVVADPVIPEVPVAAALPIAALAVGGLAYAVRRRQLA